MKIASAISALVLIAACDQKLDLRLDARTDRGADAKARAQGWAISAGGPGHEEAMLALDRKRNEIVIAGRFTGTASSGTTGRGHGIAHDSQGRITAVGRAGPADIFVARFDSAGAPLSPPVIAGGGGPDLAYAVAGDDAGHSFIAGAFSGVVGLGGETVKAIAGTDLFIWKLSP